jgi:hypothetical protein
MDCTSFHIFTNTFDECIPMSHSHIPSVLLSPLSKLVNSDNAQLIEQGIDNETTATSFSVVIEDSLVEDVVGVSGFVSDGGRIEVRNLTVSQVSLSGSLFSVSGNNGVLQVDNLQVLSGGVNMDQVSYFPKNGKF